MFSSTTTTTTSHNHKSPGPLQQQSRSLGVADTPDDAGTAYKAISITPQDTVVELRNGHRVPVEEAAKLNSLRAKEEEEEGGGAPRSSSSSPTLGVAAAAAAEREKKSRSPLRGAAGKLGGGGGSSSSEVRGGTTTIEKPPAFTNPLFPPLPVYGPPTPLRRLQCLVFRVTSGILSIGFLSVIVLGAGVKSVPGLVGSAFKRLRGKDPDAERPFYKLEKQRAVERRREERRWKRARRDSAGGDAGKAGDEECAESNGERLRRQEGGKDKLICDVGYYARRVGLDVEEFDVETEDGFLIRLQHVFDPDDLPFYPAKKARRRGSGKERIGEYGVPALGQNERGKRKYPILLMHGLLQSSGAFCVNDDDSLAFYLCKSGYDVWLGNNRCGFKPKHTVLKYSDPRMWAWNIRQMGILDLPAFINAVLTTTSFEKLALVAHSQGTTQTFIALAKQHLPELGDKISVFCALAPAVYAGPLIEKFYFKFMKIIPPSVFRLLFGIHAFIPFMMTMHSVVPKNIYGALGYRVFWFLFSWSDTNWDRGLRDRFFLFAPVYVSAESMRWWLGRECFAKHKCILATRDQEQQQQQQTPPPTTTTTKRNKKSKKPASPSPSSSSNPGSTSWFDPRFPKLALWIGASDHLVDGPRLLQRFRDGKEPDVEVVHERVVEGYEHLDVIWAVDAVKKVHYEVKNVIWSVVGVDGGGGGGGEGNAGKLEVPRGCVVGGGVEEEGA